MSHDFVYQQTSGECMNSYGRDEWIIYCRKCGRVAWVKERANEDRNMALQKQLPKKCSGYTE